MIDIIEAKSLKIVSDIINEWIVKFKYYSYEIGKIEASNNGGDENNYFSEIETYIWKNSNVEAVFNIILYLNGKRILTHEEVVFETNIQLQEILKGLINRSG